MKKFIIGLLFFVLAAGSFAQSKEWVESYNITTSKTDSVFWTGTTVDIAGYTWTATFETIGLDTSIVINIGGSNKPINTSKTRYAFEPFVYDELPYTFYPDSCNVVTNDSTTIQKTFKSANDEYGFLRPAFSLTTTTDTVFTLNVYFNFAK